jgi:site-specific recombinase XerD
MEAGDDIAQARLQQASTHWLRHTFATDLFDSGADVLSVRDLMDHASISTTSRYLHRPEERLRADLERLSRDPPLTQS